MFEPKARDTESKPETKAPSRASAAAATARIMQHQWWLGQKLDLGMLQMWRMETNHHPIIPLFYNSIFDGGFLGVAA